MPNVSSKTKVKGVRMPNAMVAELEYAAKLHGRTFNEEALSRLQAGAVEMPPEVLEGQLSLFEEKDEV